MEIGDEIELSFQKVFSDGSTEDIDYDLNKTDFDIIIKEGTAFLSLNENVAVAKASGSAKIKVIYQTKYTIDISFDIKDSSERRLTGIEIESVNTIAVSATKELKVNANYSDGSIEDVSAAVGFKSSDENVAIMTGATLKGIAAGNVKITATYNEKTASIDVKVYEYVEGKVLTKITISPEEKTLSSEESVEFVVNAEYSDGATEIVTDNATIKIDDESVGLLENNKFTAASVSEDKTVNVTASYEYGEVTKEAAATIIVKKDVVEDDTGSAGGTFQY